MARTATTSITITDITDGTTGSPAVGNTGRYKNLQTGSDGFQTNGIGSRWKIRDDEGTDPNENNTGLNQWDDEVDVLFLSSNDENGSSISDYFAQLEEDDYGRLLTSNTATSSSLPEFCSIEGNVESIPFVCDSPPGFVVFKLIAKPVRINTAGVTDAAGGVWRFAIETTRVDEVTTLSTDDNVVANFGFNKTPSGYTNSNALVALYRASTSDSSAPAAFTGTFTYTFATGVVINGELNGWTTIVPTVAQGSFLWVRQATASSNTATDTIDIGDWSTAVVMSASGIDGAAGLTTTTVSLYIADTSSTAAPQSFTGNFTYTFATGVVTGGVFNSWTTAVPTVAQGSFLWVRQATASSDTATDTIYINDWSTAVVMSASGADGAPAAGFVTTYYDLNYVDPGIATFGSYVGDWKMSTGTGISNYVYSYGGTTSWSTDIKTLFLDAQTGALASNWGSVPSQLGYNSFLSSLQIGDTCTVTHITYTGSVSFTITQAPIKTGPISGLIDVGLDGTDGNCYIIRINVTSVSDLQNMSTNQLTTTAMMFAWSRSGTADALIGQKGAGKYDRNFTTTDDGPDSGAAVVGNAKFNSAARCAVAGGYPFNTSLETVFCMSQADSAGISVDLATPVAGDAVVLTVTDSNDGVTTQAAIHKGTGVANDDWEEFALQIDGSLLVHGTVVADHLNVATIAAISADLGAITAGSLDINNLFVVSSAGVVTLKSAASGSRIEINNNRILVYDGSNLRVVLGDLTPL